MKQPSTIRLKDYSKFVEAIAFGNLFCTMNGWEVVDIDVLPDNRFAHVILWHYGREFKLLMLSTEWIECTWMVSWWIQVDKQAD